MDFVAIDFETANADLSSICQVGIAIFRDGEQVDSWTTLVNPQDYFDSLNVSIHGIDEDAVMGAPIWKDVFPQIACLISGRITVCHTTFDKTALLQACGRANLSPCDCRWLNSAMVVRRTWREFSQSGYGLCNVASRLGITYRAHDALEDARCAGLVMLRAMAESGLDLDKWLTRVQQPIDLQAGQKIVREGHPDGELFGEVLVITGTLSMPRREAADLAAAAGCRVDGGVTKHTTLLMIGDQDIRKLNGHEKSDKYRKAEAWIQKGHSIRILGESDFERIVSRPAAV
ncbi:MAG: exonuclease domain-containing protein [Edaphobacter sp.]